MSQDPTPALTPERMAALASIPYGAVATPGYVIHLGRLEENARLLARVAKRCGAKILLAQKGFACWPTYPLLAAHLQGTTASGLHEALLGKEHFGGEVHVYAPAYKEAELHQLARFAHSIIFNSLAQLERFTPLLQAGGRRVERGLRVNPEHSTVATDLYNPASPQSRLGTTRAALLGALQGRQLAELDIDGLHFHTLCEQDADALESTADAFERQFAEIDFSRLRWLNFGGGHHITRPHYDLDRLCRVVDHFRSRYGVDVYLEPGEAVALHTGVLVASVLDILEAGGIRNAILDISATCHMPDVLEMPYRPRVLEAGAPGERAHTYRLGGLSCLAGDVVGDYSFDRPLELGQRIIFLDMAHYTMVKTTTFNGVPLPAIHLYHPKTDKLETVRQFDYADYRNRLG